MKQITIYVIKITFVIKIIIILKKEITLRSLRGARRVTLATPFDYS